MVEMLAGLSSSTHVNRGVIFFYASFSSFVLHCALDDSIYPMHNTQQ